MEMISGLATGQNTRLSRRLIFDEVMPHTKAVISSPEFGWAADTFPLVGMQEFFYNEVPSDLRNISIVLHLSVSDVGNFLSSFLIPIIKNTTCGNGQDSWISDHMNHDHIDYFYYYLDGISAGCLDRRIT
nr:proton-dependent oligopeptide transporter family [Tanacetum cinerariifolium]